MVALRHVGDDLVIRQPYPDDIVGRFRSGHVVNNRPAALTEWRVTTGNPEVASVIHELFRGEAPQKWTAEGEDNLEVLTGEKSVGIILEGSHALCERMLLWGRSGKPLRVSDSELLVDETANPNEDPDPDVHLTFAERKYRARDGVGAEPHIEVHFRLACKPDLGIFKFVTGSWAMAQDLARNDTAAELISYDGAVAATLSLEEVSFVSKNGPRAGQRVTYAKPSLVLSPSVEQRRRRANRS